MKNSTHTRFYFIFQVLADGNVKMVFNTRSRMEAFTKLEELENSNPNIEFYVAR